MSYSRKPILTSFVAALVFLSGAARADEVKKPPTASFRFLRFSELPGLCARTPAGTFVMPEVYPGFIGKPVRLGTGGGVDLYKCDKAGTPEKTGDKLSPPFATIMPLATQRQLVILFGDAKKVSAEVIADNPARFPFGRVLAVNLTDKALVAEVGGASTTLPPKKATVCDMPERFAGDDNVTVKITEADTSRKRLYSSVWPHSVEVRTMAFVYRNESGRLIVRTILDANLPELAEAAEDKPTKTGTAAKPAK